MSQVRASKILQIVPLVLVLALLCPCAYGRTIRVSNTGPADYPTIQAAIDASVGGDVVLVAPGTYTGDGNRDIDFKGKAITVRSEKGPETCIIDCQGSMDEPHRGFYFHSGEDANAVVQGFTVTRGFVVERGHLPDEAGGAVYCWSSSPRIADCIVTGNFATEGGGIACLDSNSVLTGCVVTANLASGQPSRWYNSYGAGGGGVVISGSHPSLINCIIAGNRASGIGAGATCAGNFSIVNCTIYGNRTGKYGGGGINVLGAQSDSGILRNCILWANTAAGCHQIASQSVGILGTPHLEITYCTIQANQPANCLLRVEGNWTSTEPLFAKPGYWDPNGTPDDPADDFWVEGDYHLKSQAGRWDPIGEAWVKDDVTSPCIDAGDPNDPVGEEPFPNGARIDMGAYGGTVEASKSLSSVQAKYGGGRGEPGSPYYIYTAEQIAGIGAEPNDWSRHFRLMADIDLSGYTGARLPVIGVDENNPFSGVFDGNGHTISGFTRLSSMVSNGGGLFGYVAGTIKNLGLMEPNVSGEFAPYVGALVRENHGTLAGCFAERVWVAGGDYLAGGLVGRNGGTMMDCHSSGTVSGSSAGGLVAMNRGTMQGCWSAATVTGTGKKVGGLAGDNSPGTVTNCYATGVVVTGDDQTGGLIGDNSYGTVTSSYSTGFVTGNDGVGGLVGQNWAGHITNCYSAAEVTGDRIAGGLLGANTGTVTNCYATGRVSSNRWPCAGLVAWRSGGEVIESFWDVQTSERDWSEGGVGKTTAEMQTAATFLGAGWDFVGEKANGTEDIWQIHEGQDYPRLSWETATGASASGD